MKSFLKILIIALGVVIGTFVLVCPSLGQSQGDIKNVYSSKSKGFGFVGSILGDQDTSWIGRPLEKIYQDLSRFQYVGNDDVLNHIITTRGAGFGLERQKTYLFLNSTQLVETKDGKTFLSCKALSFSKEKGGWDVVYRPIRLVSYEKVANPDRKNEVVKSNNYNLLFQKNEFVVFSLPPSN